MKSGPKPKCNIGDVYVLNCGWKCKVKEYVNALNVVIEFDDRSTQIAPFANIKNGGVKPLNYPSVYGIGFFGIGRFIPRSYKPKDDQIVVDQKIYRHWVKLLDRVYNLENKHSSSNKTYKGCTIDPDWHNFQNFCEWTLTQKYWNEKDAHLDKDLLVKGNKHYSPSTCCYIPSKINLFISGCKISEKGLPRGVNYIKPRTKGSKQGYIARCYFKSDREYLGYYDDKDQASIVYNARKKEVAMSLIAEYTDVISEPASKAFHRYLIDDYF